MSRNQFDLRHCIGNLFLPSRRAFFARWQIPSLFIVAGEAEPHRGDRDAPGIIKRLFIKTHPVAQPIAGRVSEWPSRHIYAPAPEPGRQYAPLLYPTAPLPAVAHEAIVCPPDCHGRSGIEQSAVPDHQVCRALWSGSHLDARAL